MKRFKRVPERDKIEMLKGQLLNDPFFRGQKLVSQRNMMVRPKTDTGLERNSKEFQRLRGLVSTLSEAGGWEEGLQSQRQAREGGKQSTRLTIDDRNSRNKTIGIRSKSI